MSPAVGESSATEWRASANAVLRIAQVAAPASEGDFEGMSFDPSGGEAGPEVGLPGPEAVQASVDEFLRRSDTVIEQLQGDSPKAGRPLPVLISAMEVCSVLLAASQDPEDAYRTLGVDESGVASLAGPNAVLDEMQGAITGGAPPAPVKLPDELTAKLDALQQAGGKELVALGTDALLLNALEGAASGIAAVGGEAVQKAFKEIGKGLHAIRRAAAKILGWIVDHVRNLVPEQFRDQFDEKLKSLTDKIKDGVPGLVGQVLGHLLGRPPAEEAWRAAIEQRHDMTEPKKSLETVIAGQLQRIGWVSSARTAAATAVGIIKTFLAAAGPAVQIGVGAVAVVIVLFVCFEEWDGFNDIERLAA